jgi:hypothetical protein
VELQNSLFHLGLHVPRHLEFISPIVDTSQLFV